MFFLIFGQIKILRMKRILLTILAVFTLMGMLSAQDINAVFAKMPRDIVYGLNPDLNEELLENPSDTAKYVSTAIYEKIKRRALNSEFISLQTSDVGTVEIRLLPLINDSKIICVVKTVDSVIADSQVFFYTDKWEPIDGSDLFPPKDISWFLKSDIDQSTEQYEHAMQALTLLPVKLILSAEESIITASFDAKSFLTVEDYKIVEPFLTKKAKVLKWDKVKFK